MAKKATAKKAAPAKAAAKSPPGASEAPQSPPKKKKAKKKRAGTKGQLLARPHESVEKASPEGGLNIRSVNLDGVELKPGYLPSSKEEYMGPEQLLYFKRKLETWRDELIIESQQTLEHLRTEIREVGDEAERASRESDNILELRTRDRYRKLLKKIGEALKRIEEGSYGYCEETGEEIGLSRLEARPIATLTVDAQERREMFRRQFRDER
ncbi:MAG: RNA polymerase-binding protein DksA [Pseudomonadota bacterium]